MQSMSVRLEKRSEKRCQRSDTIAWRLRASSLSHIALLLEASETGYAFAWRGLDAPMVDAVLQLDLKLGAGGPERILTRVRRVTRVHDDLVVIAVENWDPHLTDTAAVAQTIPALHSCESKPRVRCHLLTGTVPSLQFSDWLELQPAQCELLAS